MINSGALHKGEERGVGVKIKTLRIAVVPNDWVKVSRTFPPLKTHPTLLTPPHGFRLDSAVDNHK